MKHKALPKIGVDLLGADVSASVLLEALLSHFAKKSLASLTFFGTASLFDSFTPSPHLRFHPVTEEILPTDNPLWVARRKTNSSMAIGLKELKEKKIDAFISAGNTGALFVSASLHLPLLNQAKRAALLTLIPTKKNPLAVLDVGASVQVNGETLFQFAKMGIAYQKTRGISHPVVGLLNIGEEKQKGTPELRKAYELLQTLNDEKRGNPVFLGNVEGRDVFRGHLDVLITDGFTGNVFLKTAEGIASFVLEQMDDLGPLGKLPGIKSIFSTLQEKLNGAEESGAILCGLEGLVIKCHGKSKPITFIHTIESAKELLEHRFLEALQQELNS